MALFLLILRRLALGVLTLWMVSVVVFLATQALGDPVKAILGKTATPERVAALREELDLNRPAIEQYGSWLASVSTGDFGTSLASGRPVTELLGSRAMNSALLVGLAALISIPLSLFVGAIAALRRDSWVDGTVNVGGVALASLPEFVIGIILILLFSTTVFKIFPPISRINPREPIWGQLDMFVLPVATLVLALTPYISRILRASMIEVLESEYVMMARLKGLRDRLVLWRHALPNAIVPTIQVIALQLAWLAGGIVVVEYLFAFPGIGALLVDAVANRDLPVIQAVSIIIAGVYVAANLVADILTILVSPKLRTGMQ